MKVLDTLTGWNKLLHQKCNKNQILQTQSINQPECIQDPEAKIETQSATHYAYGAMLEPGYHQLIVYDPLLNKAFCTEFLVDLNPHQIIYPDLPFCLEEISVVEQLPPVFDKWIRDTYQRQQSTYVKDTNPFAEDGEPRHNFEPSRFMKDP